MPSLAASAHQRQFKAPKSTRSSTSTLHSNTLRLRPCRRTPCQQATVDWLTGEMGHFLYPKPSSWRAGGSILGTWDSIFGDPGIQGVTQQALGGPGVHFYRF